MRYIPTTINQAELDILNRPYLGGDFSLYMTRVSAILIGSIAMTAATTGTFTDNAATALPSAGTDLQVVCSSPLRSTVNTVITLACTDDADIAVNGVATFAPPAWASNDSKNFQRGYATDLIPSVADKDYKTITSLTSIVGGDKLCSFDIYQLPVLTDYEFMGCLEGVNWNGRDRMPIGIDCGLESDAFIAQGKTAKGELSIKHKHRGWADGISRFGGSKNTVMLAGIKDGQVTADRVVFTQFIPGTKFDLPEGEGVATADGGGKFVEVMYFVAGYTP